MLQAEAIDEVVWRLVQFPTEMDSASEAQASVALPSENIAAIKLLDSWLDEDALDHSKEWEEIKRTINENRLSDRKPFSL